MCRTSSTTPPAADAPALLDDSRDGGLTPVPEWTAARAAHCDGDVAGQKPSGFQRGRGLEVAVARWQLLSAVCDTPLTVARAARRLGVARQGVQRIASDLVREELATFRANPDHRSSPLLELTPAGSHVLDAITVRAAEAHRALAADIPVGEIAAARSLLRRIVEEVRRHQADDRH
ncbi:MarR family transcriptional regulator [Streptomyces sp. NPDC051320]|uniref:MarR family winged helix-turn-helix transcriptional regulator n=1 Tax=Streptomyces sp. NPDC051320 TaxID=3154644 RepID=UPI003431044E